MGQAAGRGGKGGGKSVGVGGKGGGKGGVGNDATPKDRTCERIGCRAAVKQQPTYGGGATCFCCGLSMATTLPVEQLVEWAFQKRLDAKVVTSTGKEAKAAAADTTAAAAPPKTPPLATLEPEQLAARRVERLAALKNATSAQATQPTPLQEVAKVFVEQVKACKKLEYDDTEQAHFKGLDECAKLLLDSIQAETLPSEVPLKSAQEVCESLLAKSVSFQKDQGRTQADLALQTTRAVLTTMRSGGTKEDDEVLLLLVSREKKQATEAKRLVDKAPSKELRLATLESIKTDFAKSQQAQTDRRCAGAVKAAERAAARYKAADKLLEAARHMRLLAEAATDRLNEAHTERSSRKDQQGAAVVALLEEKISDLDGEDLVFEDAATDTDEPTTSTEDDRDESKRLAVLLQQQLQQLQEAAARSDVTIAEQNAALQAQAPSATAPADWWEDLRPDFEAATEQLPALEGEPTGTQKEAVDKLKALFRAVPWGSTLPSVQFEHLGVLPCFIHGLVGDTIWQACWGDRHGNITLQHAVPYKLLNVAKHVVEGFNTEQTQVQLDEGKTHYLAVQTEAEKRRVERRGPY